MIHVVCATITTATYFVISPQMMDRKSGHMAVIGVGPTGCGNTSGSLVKLWGALGSHPNPNRPWRDNASIDIARARLLHQYPLLATMSRVR